jgi:hypothetical protein
MRLQAVLCLDEIFKDTIDAVEDSPIAAEVCGEPALDAVLSLDNFLYDLEIGFNIGATKSVNRLLRIPDDEDFSRNYSHSAPVRRGRTGLFGQVKQDLILDRIGILKFVEENRAVAPFQIGPHARVIAHQVAGAHQQTFEGDMALAHEALAEMRCIGNEQAPEDPDQLAINPDEALGGAHDDLSVFDIFRRPSLGHAAERFLGEQSRNFRVSLQYMPELIEFADGGMRRPK